MWESEEQRLNAVRDVLAAGHLEYLWDDEPTEVAIQYVEQGSPLSHGQAVLLKVAFDIWNGSGKATVDEVFSVLDDENLSCVLNALLASRPGVRLKR